MSARLIGTPERIAILEFEVQLLKGKIDETNEKLDQLLELKSKGMGAFWLLSILFGSGLLGLVTWMKG